MLYCSFANASHIGRSLDLLLPRPRDTWETVPVSSVMRLS